MAIAFRCEQCGGELGFDPGTTDLACPYCGAHQEIAASPKAVEELDYQAHLASAAEAHEVQERITVTCSACGAETTFEANVTSDECPFCGTNMVLTTRSSRLIKPRALLPFKVGRKAAVTAFRKWLRGLWFAPSKLKKLARTVSEIAGVYIPYWTYDCNATSRYTGMRGDDYTVTERYTTTENGRTVTRTRQVTRTRWRPAAGTVHNSFDDVLVLASESLPHKYAERLEPWDLDNLVPYQDDFLSGFRAESYRIDLEQGFVEARTIMERTIRATVEQDIGGDHQVINSLDIRHTDITFKHVLLPVWISAYRFKERVFRFLVNARTGEVQGERPWSWIKITLAALAALAVIGAVYMWISG